jgi:hypothetical protein
MAELADALALGASGRKAVQVQVLFRAPSFRNGLARKCGGMCWVEYVITLANSRKV